MVPVSSCAGLSFLSRHFLCFTLLFHFHTLPFSQFGLAFCPNCQFFFGPVFALPRRTIPARDLHVLLSFQIRVGNQPKGGPRALAECAGMSGMSFTIKSLFCPGFPLFFFLPFFTLVPFYSPPICVNTSCLRHRIRFMCDWPLSFDRPTCFCLLLGACFHLPLHVAICMQSTPAHLSWVSPHIA